MTITPFLTIRLRGKKDALYARQKARRVAHLLGYDAREQACIAAAVFVVACQALPAFDRPHLFFVVENRQLQVFAQTRVPSMLEPPQASSNRITEIIRVVEPVALYRLSKPLPENHAMDLMERDLGWLVNKVEETASEGMFAEIVKQNQEILTLLHELRSYQTNLAPKEQNLQNPHAA